MYLGKNVICIKLNWNCWINTQMCEISKCRAWQKCSLLWRMVCSRLSGLGQVTHLSPGEDTFPTRQHSSTHHTAELHRRQPMQPILFYFTCSLQLVHILDEAPDTWPEWTQVGGKICWQIRIFLLSRVVLMTLSCEMLGIWIYNGRCLDILWSEYWLGIVIWFGLNWGWSSGSQCHAVCMQ